MPTVAIAGLTGKFAQCVTKTLLEDPHVSIRGYVRNAGKLPQALRQNTRVEVVEGEYNDAVAARKFVDGADIVICGYFGPPDLMTQGQKVLIDACEDANVPRYIAGDFAVDFTKIPDGELFPKESAKIIMKYLQNKKVQGVHILIGGLMETFFSPFFNLFDAETQTLNYWGNGSEHWDLTTFQTAADYAAAIALDPKATGIFRFLADRKSAVEIKQVYEKAYGSTLNLKRLGSLEELYTNVKTTAKNHPDEPWLWGASGFTYWCVNGQAYLGDNLDNSKYPHVKTVNLEDFFSLHKKDEVANADQKLGF